MKKILLGFIAFTCFAKAQAQSAKLEWGKAYGGASYEIGHKIVTDSKDFIYSVGTFSGTVDFDPGTGVTSLSSKGSSDVFITKFDKAGNLLWAKQIGGTFEDQAYSICLGDNSNLYVSGSFVAAADFDPSPLVTSVSAKGVKDIFIVKLDSEGNFFWVNTYGGVDSDEGFSHVYDASESVFMTGSFIGTADFYPGAPIFNITSGGMSDVFVNKMDKDGRYVWTRTFGGGGFDKGVAITSDNLGNTYVTGTLSGGGGDFDPGGGITKLVSKGETDIFVSKFNTNGVLLWVRQIGYTGFDEPTGIDVDDAGNILLSGSFSNTVDFNPSELDADTFNLIAKGSTDAFILKLDPAGNFMWAKSMGGAGNSCAATAVHHDYTNAIYVTGVFSGTVDINPDTATVNLTASGMHDIYIQCLSVTGNLIWVKRLGGLKEDSARSIFVDGARNIHTTGSIAGLVDLDPAPETNDALAAGNSDVLIHRMNWCTVTNRTLKDTGCGGKYNLDIFVTYTKSGSYKQTITGTSGCEENVSLDLIVPDMNDTITKSGVVLTAANTYPGIKYQWIVCGSKKIIPGATAKSYIAIGDGNYAVVVSYGKCSDTSDCINITGIPNNINEQSLQENVVVFPNPAQGEFVIQVSENMTGAKATIVNMLGQTVRTVDLKSQITQQSLDAGFYLIEIEKGNEKTTRKLIVN